jgi:AraC-like DNA-binding protein
MNDSMTMPMNRIGANYHFYIYTTESPDLIHPASIDAAITAIVKMSRILIGDSFAPIEVQMKGARSASAVCLETFVQAPILYDRDDYMLIIDRHDAERNLPSSNTELIRANETIAMQYLSKLERSNITIQVSKLVELLPSGQIRKETVASALNVSVRTLYRKLREEGESFNHILTTIKKEMAGHYIQDSQLSINEIAYLLGFSDQANFTRAFRRWNGSSPTEYRMNLRNNQL